MQLIVSGLPPLSNPDHFSALFGRYVYGFNPWTHCDRCFVSRQEMQISPKMANGIYELQDDLFYLCGVGRKLSRSRHPEGAQDNTNVHFAVRSRKGSSAAVGSVYGAMFLFKDAQSIPIKAPVRHFPALELLPEPKRTAHKRCKMFHFAYQMFDVDGISLEKGASVHKLREDWRNLSGIKSDDKGSMIDPKLSWLSKAQ